MAVSRKLLEDSSGKPATVAADGPQACPKCRSTDTSTAAKKPIANCYWRCLKCGEVWNPALLANERQWWRR